MLVSPQRFYPPKLEEERLDIPYDDFVPQKFTRRSVRTFYEYDEASRITIPSQLPAGGGPPGSHNHVMFLWFDKLHETLSKKEMKKLGKRLSLLRMIEVRVGSSRLTCLATHEAVVVGAMHGVRCY